MISNNDTSSNAADNSSQNTKNNTRDHNPNITAAAEAAPIPKSENNKAEEAKTNWTEIFAFAAAIGGIIAAIFSGWQAWIASDNEQRSLRAYISAGIEKYPDIINDNFEMTLVYKNRGQTPAFHVNTWAQTAFGDNPLPEADIDAARDFFSHNSIRQDAALFPQAEFRSISLNNEDEFRLVSPLTVDQKVALKAGWKTFWLFGEVHYVDVFGKSHITHYRLFMTGEYMVRLNKLFWAPRGNEAD